MSTTVHRPAHPHLVWYAAIALLAALVAVLAITVVGNARPSSPTELVPSGRSAPTVGEKRHPSGACFSTRPGASRDLTTICIHRVP